MKDLVRIFKALGDETRFAAVQVLLEKEHSVTEMVAKLGRPQPAVSSALRILEDSGIISKRREGKRIICSLNENINKLIEAARDE